MDNTHTTQMMKNPGIYVQTAALTGREKEVLKLISEQYSNKEIGSLLYLSHHTVHSHRRNLMSKLNVKNTAGLIRRGFELDILQVRRPIGY